MDHLCASWLCAQARLALDGTNHVWGPLVRSVQHIGAQHEFLSGADSRLGSTRATCRSAPKPVMCEHFAPSRNDISRTSLARYI